VHAAAGHAPAQAGMPGCFCVVHWRARGCLDNGEQARCGRRATPGRGVSPGLCWDGGLQGWAGPGVSGRTLCLISPVGRGSLLGPWPAAGRGRAAGAGRGRLALSSAPAVTGHLRGSRAQTGAPGDTAALLRVLCEQLAAMASFGDAPAGDLAAGEKIFKTKCAQCHVAEAGGGHKQVLQQRRRARGGVGRSPPPNLRSRCLRSLCRPPGPQPGRPVRPSVGHSCGLRLLQSKQGEGGHLAGGEALQTPGRQSAAHAGAVCLLRVLWRCLVLPDRPDRGTRVHAWFDIAAHGTLVGGRAPMHPPRTPSAARPRQQTLLAAPFLAAGNPVRREWRRGGRLCSRSAAQPPV